MSVDFWNAQPRKHPPPKNGTQGKSPGQLAYEATRLSSCTEGCLSRPGMCYVLWHIMTVLAVLDLFRSRMETGRAGDAVGKAVSDPKRSIQTQRSGQIVSPRRSLHHDGKLVAQPRHLITRSNGRRPKIAKARNRGERGAAVPHAMGIWRLVLFSLADGKHIRPLLGLEPSSAEVVEGVSE
jgi:hypothetical protein